MPVPSLPLPLPQFFIGILKETQESKLLTALEIRITAQTTVGFKDDFSSLTGVAQLVGTLFHKPKRHRFDFQSGHTPRLRVQSPVGACTRGNQSMFLTHINVFSPSLSLPSSLPKSNEKKCPQVRVKNICIFKLL